MSAEVGSSVPASSRSTGPALGTGPGANRSAGGVASPDGGAELLEQLLAPCGRARTPRSTTRSFTWSVPSRASRCGHAARGDRRARPRRATRASPRRGRRRRARPPTESALRRVPSRRSISRAAPRPATTTRSCAGASGSASAPVAVTSVCPATPRRALRIAAPVGVELGERVVEEQEGRDVAALVESSSASARRSESTARRCSPCEPKARRSRSPDSTRISSRCGPSAGRAALEVACEPLRRGRRGSAAPRRSRGRGREPELRRREPRTAGESSSSEPPRPRRARRRASRRCSVHGSSAVGVGEPLRDPAQRGVPLPEGRAVGAREVGPRGQHAVRGRGRSTRAGPPGRPSRRRAGRG